MGVGGGGGTDDNYDNDQADSVEIDTDDTAGSLRKKTPPPQCAASQRRLHGR